MGLAVSLIATPRYTLPQTGAAKQNLRGCRCAKTTRGEPIRLAPRCFIFSLAVNPSILREPRRNNSQLFSIRGAGLLLSDDRVDVQAQPFGNAAAVGRIGFVEVLNLQLLDALRHAVAEAGDDIID